MREEVVAMQSKSVLDALRRLEQGLVTEVLITGAGSDSFSLLTKELGSRFTVTQDPQRDRLTVRLNRNAGLNGDAIDRALRLLERNGWNPIIGLGRDKPLSWHSSESVTPSAPPLPVEEATEPLIGWRAWKLRSDGTLESPQMATVWPGPVARAGKPSPWDPHALSGLLPSSEREPVVFGIYAYNAPLEYSPHFPYGAPRAWAGPVIGRVALSGTVICHEKGYRAEIATIQQLYYIQRTTSYSANLSWLSSSLPSLRAREMVPLLMERYQCDVTLDLSDLQPPPRG